MPVRLTDIVKTPKLFLKCMPAVMLLDETEAAIVGFYKTTMQGYAKLVVPCEATDPLMNVIKTDGVNRQLWHPTELTWLKADSTLCEVQKRDAEALWSIQCQLRTGYTSVIHNELINRFAPASAHDLLPIQAWMQNTPMQNALPS